MATASQPALDFGQYRATKDTVWRTHHDRFEPHYHVDPKAHHHHRFVERADHDLSHAIANQELELELWNDALKKNVLGALGMDGSEPSEDAIADTLGRGPEGARNPRDTEALRYATFYDALTELLRNPPMDPTDPRVQYGLEKPEHVIARAAPRKPEAVLALHRQLFTDLLPDAGQFKREPTFSVDPSGEVTHVATQPEHVEAELTALLQWVHDAWEHPLIRIEVFYHEFLSIDPFRAGTERVAMALHTVLLATMGYPSVMYAPVNHQFFRTRGDYRAALVEGQRSGDLTRWVTYMAQALISAYAEPADRALFRRVLPRGLDPELRRIAEAVAKFTWALPGESISLALVASMMPDVPRRTMQRHLRALCDAGVLRRSGTNRGARYALIV